MVGLQVSLFICGLLGVAMSTSMALSGKRGKRGTVAANEAENPAEKDDDDAVNIEEGGTKSSLTKEEEKAEGPDEQPEPKVHICRFCNQIFLKSQALGGHMNKHRTEKEQEELARAHTLIGSRVRGSSSWSSCSFGPGAGVDPNAMMFGSQNDQAVFGTGLPPQQFPFQASASTQPNQFQRNQPSLAYPGPQQLIGHGQRAGENVGLFLPQENPMGRPAQQPGIGSLQLGSAQLKQASYLPCGNAHGNEAYVSVVHSDIPLMNPATGPSQSVHGKSPASSCAAPVSSNVAFMHQFQQQQQQQVHGLLSGTQQYGDMTHMHPSAAQQFAYEVSHPNHALHRLMQQFQQVPPDDSQTSIDQKSETTLMGNQSVGTDLQSGDLAPQECGAENSINEVGGDFSTYQQDG